MEDSNRFYTEDLWGRGLEFYLDSIPKRSSWSTVASRSIADQDLYGPNVYGKDLMFGPEGLY